MNFIQTRLLAQPCFFVFFLKDILDIVVVIAYNTICIL